MPEGSPLPFLLLMLCPPDTWSRRRCRGATACVWIVELSMGGMEARDSSSPIAGRAPRAHRPRRPRCRLSSRMAGSAGRLALRRCHLSHAGKEGALPSSGVAEGPLGIVTAVQILNRQLDELRVVALEPDLEQGDLLEGFVVKIAPEMLEPCPRRRFGGLSPSCRTGSRYCMQQRRRFGGPRRRCCCWACSSS